MKKVTFITGASSGLGKEFAKLYFKDGNDLLLIGSNEERLRKAAEEIKEIRPEGMIDCFVADLSDINECKKAFAYTVEKDYFVNNLVNSAGIGDRTDFRDMDIDKNIALNHINCDALLYFTRVFLDNMLDNAEGHIINVGSIAGFVPGPFMATYHASKAYVLTLGESLARELKFTPVNILTLCPGPFESEFVAKAHNDYTFSKIKPKTAAEVALYGYKMSRKGKTMRVVGVKNKVTCFAPRLVPRKLTADVSAKQMKELHKHE
ncbi:MAG: SDR family NAD(P)-dependent oxidoreductase [Clostridia bacterium]|nr:SDR family NAD(P)-dependent oxidoreductase [Clostridia bacterium]